MAIVKTVFQFRRDTTENWLLNGHIKPAAGEPCFDVTAHTLKIGDGELTYAELPTIGGVELKVEGDGKSIVLEDNVFKLVGFDATKIGAQPRISADGKLEWIVPSTETVEGLQSAVAGLQSDVTNLQTTVTTIQEIVIPSGEDTVPLLTRIETLEVKMDGTDEGSVDAKIDAKINEFATKVSNDDTVNTIKELVDYVADHGPEAADMAADIASLQDLVGDTNVSERIASSVAGKVDKEDGKSLVDNALITKLDAIEDGAQANRIESIQIGNTLLENVGKTVVIPVGAGLKVSEEITIAEDGTLGIGVISFSKIAQVEDETVVMDGGGAAG